MYILNGFEEQSATWANQYFLEDQLNIILKKSSTAPGLYIRMLIERFWLCIHDSDWAGANNVLKDLQRFTQ